VGAERKQLAHTLSLTETQVRHFILLTLNMLLFSFTWAVRSFYFEIDILLFGVLCHIIAIRIGLFALYYLVI